MKKTSLFLVALVLLISMIVLSCKSKNSKAPAAGKKDTPVTKKEEPVKPQPELKYERPPIINIVDTVSVKRIVIYSKDSAASFEGIRMKLGNLYKTKLADYIKKNNLKMAGGPVAWYKKQKAPYFFEAGLQVNKKGTKSVAGVQVRELGIGKVVVAHFYGPYELIPQGYDAVREWMKDNKKTAAGAPYEIYITDPVDKEGKAVDPYKIRTDIIFPIR